MRIKELILAALAACLLAPSVAMSATCDDLGNTYPMTTQTSANVWNCGGTPAAVDDYVVDTATSDIALAGTFGMNSLTISAGNVFFSPDLFLSLTGTLRIEGTATIQSQTRRLWSGYASSFTWSGTNASQVVTVTGMDFGTDTDIQVGDIIRIRDEDPADLLAYVTTVHIGPGRPGAGVHRPELGKWKSWRVVTVGTDTLTFEYDQCATGGSLVGSGCTYAAGAYEGTRMPVTGITVSANVRDPDSSVPTSILTVAGGTLARNGDLGSRMAEWTAGPCVGKQAKIRHTLDNGATDDIYVLGFVQECGTSNIDATPGPREGTYFEVVRIPTIDCAHNADCAIAWDMANADPDIDGLRIIRPTFISTDDYGASAAEFCTVCFYNSTGTDTQNGDGFWHDVEIAYPECNTSSDTSVFGVMSTGAGGATPLGGEKAALVNTELRRWYIHDQTNTGTSVGCHGVFHRNPGDGVDLAQFRVERMNDDLYGASLGQLGEANAGKTSWTQILAFEQMPNYTSSESMLDIGAGASATYAEYVAAMGQEVRGFFGFGGSGRIHDNNTLGSTYADMVTGGADNSAQTSGGQNVFFTTGSSTPSGWPAFGGVDPFTSQGNTISNSIFFSDGDATAPSLRVGGLITNSILLPGISDSLSLLQMGNLQETFMDIGGNAEPFAHPGTNGVSLYSMEMTDVVVGGDGMTHLFSALYDATATYEMRELTTTRVYFPAGTINATNGLSANGLTDSGGDGQTWTADGVIISATTIGTGGMGSFTTNAGAQVTNACADTDDQGTDAGSFGANKTASSHNVPGVGIHAGRGVPLRSWVEDTGSACKGPANLGPNGWPVSWALMGDFANEQWRGFTTYDVIRATSGGGGGAGIW